MVRCHHTTDAATARAAVVDYLALDPINNNLIFTILEQGLDQVEPWALLVARRQRHRDRSRLSNSRKRRASPSSKTDGIPLLAEWTFSFGSSIGSPRSGDLAPWAARAVEAGITLLWMVDQEAVSMALATSPLFGVSRIGHVDTPPAHRNNGYGDAVTAALTSLRLVTGASSCMLYTQLANATSNNIYRTIGYEAVAEVTMYSFSTGSTAS